MEVVKKDDNSLTEGVNPDDMTSQQLEELITKGKETVKEEKKEVKDEQPKEKIEKGKEESKEVVKEDSKKEELKAGKFKTEDDLIKAYQEAEKKISQQGEESSRFRKQAEAYKQRLQDQYEFDDSGNIIGVKQQPTAQMAQQVDQLAQLRSRFPNMSDEEIMSMVGLMGMMVNTGLRNFKQEIDRDLEPVYDIKFEKAVERQKSEARKNYPDYAELEAEVNEKLEQIPKHIRAKEGSVETIFLTVRGSHLPEFVEKARQSALTDKQVREEKKEDSFVESGGKSHVPTPPVNPDNMTSKELEAYINKLKR